MSTSEYQVTGMTCGHCEMSVREEVGTVPGVKDIQVSAQTGKLVVTSTDTGRRRRGDRGRRGGRLPGGARVVNTPTRLGLYGAGLAVVFGGAFAAAGAVVPHSTVDHWTQEAKGHQMNTVTNSEMSSGPDSGSHAGHVSAGATETAVRGVSSAQDGYLLTPVTAPGQIDKAGHAVVPDPRRAR